MKPQFAATILSCILLLSCNKTQVPAENNALRRADSLLRLMTLKEKIGQMAQLSGHAELTGALDTSVNYINEVINGRVGSLLNITGSEYTRKMQELAVSNSRLGIPLLFGYDVIHGYKTIFPIPLGEAASWDLEAIELSAKTAALEAASAGIHWTFAPMVDVTRDARWGRIMEGAGEDNYLGMHIARARIRGFQGSNLSSRKTVAACAKHYAGYGFSEGGRDYNTTEISYRTLREYVLPPFKTAVDENVASFMTSFNDLNGIPASGNKMLGDILRNEWMYNGLVVSDWNSIGELLIHGMAENMNSAAILALQAGIDMDMEGNVYVNELEALVQNKEIPKSFIDDAARRILCLKFELGLFDDPFKYCDQEYEKKAILSDENRKAARDVAKESIVLLKNNNNVLPIKSTVKNIAVIGPLADNRKDIIGNWCAKGSEKDGISLLKGIKKRFPDTDITFSKGCDIQSTDKSGFQQAYNIGKSADIILIALGEAALMSGESHSRTNLNLPGVQLELLQKLRELNKPLVLILMNGRPLAIPEAIDISDAVLETWFLGTETGHAIADVISGDYNPSGKLPVTFPNTSGQVPIYYNHKNTGRPGTPDVYTSRYDDAPIAPLFPFGYGLSYTTYEYIDLTLDKKQIDKHEDLTISVTLKNTGKYDGHEVIQMYIRDVIGSVTRPVKELKGFKKVFLKKGESKTISFSLTSGDLAFWGSDMTFKAEPGLFKVMIGSSSLTSLEDEFELID